MYTATMIYTFREEAFDQACELWRDEILDQAKTQEGFIRMQFLVARPKALAIGSWEDNLHARAFMQSGAFKRLMEKIGPLISEQPQQAIWDLKYYASHSG